MKTVTEIQEQITGLIRKGISHDGNCLYNALHAYIPQDIKTLREMVADYLETHMEAYQSFIILPKGQTVADYIYRVKHTNEWAGDMEINILIKLLDRPIISIGLDGKIVNKQILPLSQGTPIFVFYDGINHYDAALLQKNFTPEIVLATLLQDTEKSKIAATSTMQPPSVPIMDTTTFFRKTAIYLKNGNIQQFIVYLATSAIKHQLPDAQQLWNSFLNERILASKNRLFQYAIGRLFETGTSVMKNYRTAIRWYKKAANQECAEAQYALARLYNAPGIKQNKFKSRDWCLKAIKQGHKTALEYYLKKGFYITKVTLDHATTQAGLEALQRRLFITYYVIHDITEEVTSSVIKLLTSKNKTGLTIEINDDTPTEIFEELYPDFIEGVNIVLGNISEASDETIPYVSEYLENIGSFGITAQTTFLPKRICLPDTEIILNDATVEQIRYLIPDEITTVGINANTSKETVAALAHKRNITHVVIYNPNSEVIRALPKHIVIVNNTLLDDEPPCRKQKMCCSFQSVSKIYRGKL